jgi:hypothetical protein
MTMDAVEYYGEGWEQLAEEAAREQAEPVFSGNGAR